jgi:HEAT repeat protein
MPWLLAAAGLAFGSVVWLASPTLTGREATGTADEALAAKRLGLSLQTAQAENQVLRRELDRLSALVKQSGAGTALGGSSPAGGKGASSRPKDGTLDDLTNLLKEALALAAAGDARAKADAAQAVADLIRSGPQAFSALRDVYLATTDPHSRKLLLASMVFSGSAEVKDFVMDQVQNEKDPEVRRTLMTNAARYATRDDLNGGLTSTFVQSIDASDEDPATRAAAVRGLRYAHGTAAPDALMRAANDPSEEVRISAIDVIASRPGGERALQKLASSDASLRVREFAQCRLLIAQTLR